MAKGWKHHQAGDLHQAEQQYRLVLALDPRHVDALYLCGAACQVQGRLDEAVALYQQVLTLRPQHADVLNNLGAAQAARGQIAEAASYYRQAMKVKPNDVGTLNNLGISLTELGQLEEAIGIIRRALELRPDQAESYYNLGNALQKNGQLDEAEASYRQALRLQPNYLEAQNNLAAALTGQKKAEEAILLLRRVLESKPDYAEAYGNLGNALKDQGHLDEAVSSYQEAVRLKPADANAHINLGQALLHVRQLEEGLAHCQEALRLQPNSADAHCAVGIAYVRLKKSEEALRYCEQALRLKPDSAAAYCAMGDAFGQLGKVEESERCCREAVRLKPDFAEAHCALAIALGRQGKLEESAHSHEESLACKPDYPEAHFGLGLTRLLLGQLERGWPGYEWRWKCRDLPRPRITKPCWDGSPLADRTILVHAEQGLGDTLQFVRYLPLVKERGGTVVVECQETLLPLLASCPGIDRLVTQGGGTPVFDTHIPLMSLPGLFRTTLETIPANVPYLFADPLRKERWRQELSTVEAFKIGIAWQGNPKHPGDPQRSIPLARFAPLAQLAGVQMYSIQKGLGIEQLDEVADRFSIIDLGSRFDNFADTAAALANLDLVLTVDSAVAHCAGALGIPVWVLVPFAPDWRWLLEREDSPWYPSMRLFRQTEPDEWDDVFDRLADALAERVAQSGDRATTGDFSLQSAPRPDTSAAMDLALQHHRAGELHQAEQIYQQILRADPVQADAWRNLGAVYLSQGKFSEAAAHCQQALRCRPDFPEACNDLGAALGQQGKDKEAEASFRQALQLRPQYPEALSNLAVALVRRWESSEAITLFEQCLRLKPHYAEGHCTLGHALRQLGRPEEAVRSYERALSLKPDYAEAHYGLGLTRLVLGDFERGWSGYEWRWQQPDFPRRTFSQLRWDGSPLTGRTILLHAEQGLGDTLQFIRYAPLVKQRGGFVIAECPETLLLLLATCAGIDRLVAQGQPLPAFSLHAPLMSLPLLFHTTLETIPADIPYLSVDPERKERWQWELGSGRTYKIGIAWQGFPQHLADRERSLPLLRFAPLAKLPGVQLFSLQKGPGAEQLTRLSDRLPIIDLGSRFDSFADTAAALANLDLVITVDTAVAHCAGALGLPVWVLLPFSPDWRWLLNREDSPWYPSMRLFRQLRPGDWEDVFSRVAAVLTERLTAWVGQSPDRATTSGAPTPDNSAVIAQALQHHRAGELYQAEQLYQQILQTEPDHADAWRMLGAVYLAQEQFAEAATACRGALQGRPNFPEAYNDLGAALGRQGKDEEAEASFRRALQLRPRYPEALANLGHALRQRGLLEEAAHHYEEALSCNPSHKDAHLGLAMIRLLQGDFERGWSEYEWRWQQPHTQTWPFPQPLWDGSPFAGRTILLYAEQGLGDGLQFIRYAPLVKQRGGTVVVECQETLLPLLATCPGIDRLIALGEALPAFDFHALLMSLPLLFHSTLDTIPANVPYLSVDPERKERWRQELSAILPSPPRGEGGLCFKIGIAWQGYPGHADDRERSIPLTRFAQLARLPGVQLFSVQKGPGTEQLAGVVDHFSIIDLGSRFDNFADTAAALANLDLVLTIDSALAHCAGALGLPIWVLLPFAPDWRWLLNREDSPWYPSMRLFRQTRRSDWDDVFDRVAGALTKLLPDRIPVLSPESAPRIGAKTALLPDNSAALALALQHQRSGQRHKAEQLYRQILQNDPRNTEAWSYLGALLLAQDRFAEAVTSFQQVLRHRPDFAEIHNDLGVAFAQQGKVHEAVASFRRAVQLRPSYPEAHNNLGILLGQRGEVAEAIRHFQRALRDKPNYVEAKENLEQAQSQLGSGLPSAVPAAPAARSGTDEAVTANKQAINLAMQGKLEEAIASFQHALRLNPDYPDAHNNLGNVFYFQKRYAEAVACYEQAIRLRPDFGEAYNNLANSLSCLQRYQEAATNCRKALALKPDFAGAHNNLGVALKGLGLPQEAIACYRRALRLQPDFAEAQRNLDLALIERVDREGSGAG